MNDRYGQPTIFPSEQHEPTTAEIIKSFSWLKSGEHAKLHKTSVDCLLIALKRLAEAEAKNNPINCAHCGMQGIDTDIGYTYQCDCESLPERLAEARKTSRELSIRYREMLNDWNKAKFREQQAEAKIKAVLCKINTVVRFNLVYQIELGHFMQVDNKGEYMRVADILKAIGEQSE